ILCFVCINESKIEKQSRFEPLELFDGVSQTKVDPVCESRFGPVPPRDGGPLFVIVQTDELASRPQTAGNAQGAVPGECPNLNGTSCGESRNQLAQKRALLVADLTNPHFAQGGRLSAQRGQNRIIQITAASLQVAVLAVIELDVLCAHAATVAEGPNGG